MKCLRCENEMTKANFAVGMSMSPYIWNKKKGKAFPEQRTSLSCFVCTECGHTEFVADEPKKMITEE